MSLSHVTCPWKSIQKIELTFRKTSWVLALLQEFFKSFIEDPEFIAERRKALRIRSGLKPEDFRLVWNPDWANNCLDKKDNCVINLNHPTNIKLLLLCWGIAIPRISLWNRWGDIKPIVCYSARSQSFGSSSWRVLAKSSMNVRPWRYPLIWHGCTG